MVRKGRMSLDVCMLYDIPCYIRELFPCSSFLRCLTGDHDLVLFLYLCNHVLSNDNNEHSGQLSQRDTTLNSTHLSVIFTSPYNYKFPTTPEENKVQIKSIEWVYDKMLQKEITRSMPFATKYTFEAPQCHVYSSNVDLDHHMP